MGYPISACRGHSAKAVGPPRPATFAADHPKVVWAGIRNQTAGPPFTTIYYWTSQGSQVRFTATGTDATVHLQGEGSFTITVDGGAPVTATPSGAVQDYVIFGGLADARHAVVLEWASGFGSFFDKDAFVTVTGTEPSLGYYPGDGPIYAVVPDAAFIQVDGTAAPVTYSGPNQWQQSYQAPQAGFAPGARLRFAVTNLTGLRIFGYNHGVYYTVIIDGVDQFPNAPVRDANNSTYDVIPLASGLSLSGVHEVEIVDVGALGAYSTFFQLITAGGTVGTTPLPARPPLVYYGDSIPAGYDGTNYTAWISYAHQLSVMLGKPYLNLGIGGAPYKDVGGAVPIAMEARTSDVTGIGVAPDILFLGGPTNDANQSYGAETAAECQAAVLSTITTLAAAYPTTRIVVMGLLDVAANETVILANFATFDAAALAATVAAGGRAQFASMVGVIDPVIGHDTVEGLHLNYSGHTKVSIRLRILVKDLLTNLAAYYALNGSLADSSGNGKDLANDAGTPAYGAGVLGQCLKATAALAVVSRTNDVLSGSLAAGSFTVAGWFRIDASLPISTITFSDGSGSPLLTVGIMGFGPPPQPFVDVVGATGTPFKDVSQTGGAWNHIAFVASAGAGTLYVNGAAVGGARSLAGAGTFDPTGKISVTADPQSSSPAYADELAIYSRALSAAEVLASYNGGYGWQPTI